MKITSERFGEIETDEKELLHLPDGLIGFPQCTRVLLLEHKPGSPFRWLQSADQPELAFVVIDPLELVPDYPLDALRKVIFGANNSAGDLAVAAIATVPPAPAPITVNLVAPLVFDAATRKGAQIVLSDSRFRTRHILSQQPADPKESEKNEQSREDQDSP